MFCETKEIHVQLMAAKRVIPSPINLSISVSFQGESLTSKGLSMGTHLKIVREK